MLNPFNCFNKKLVFMVCFFLISCFILGLGIHIQLPFILVPGIGSTVIGLISLFIYVLSPNNNKD